MRNPRVRTIRSGIPESGITKPEGWRFDIGARVRKVRGASWDGVVVGFYATGLSPEGYAVESIHECGSVQIYPVSALEHSDA
jgi:hypothetical protein